MNKQNNPIASDSSILRYFARELLKRKKQLIFVIFIPIGTLCLNTLLPYFTGQLLAALGTNIDQASRYLPYIIAVGALGAITHRIGAARLFQLQARIMADLQMLCLNTLLRQSVGFHNNRVAGKLVSEAIDFPLAFNTLSSALLLQITPLAGTLVVGITLVSVQSWQLGLVLLGMTLATVGSAVIISKRRRPLRTKRQNAAKEVTAHLADTIVNSQTVKTFAQENKELKSHSDLNEKLYDIRHEDWTSGAIVGNNRIIGLLCFQVLFAFIIIHLVKDDPSLLATGIFAFTYSVTLSNNLFTVNAIIRQIEDALVQAAPMMEVLHNTPSIQDAPNSTSLSVSKGGIDFTNVTFSYQDSSSQEAVFDKLNLTIKPGEKIGLVGPSGGGKSTLTRLLLRFNDIQKGSIRIDGQDIAAVQQSSLREAVAYVPQEPLMFHRSIRENIAYGKALVSDDDVIAAAKEANAHDFIMQLPDGYDTLVGERGVKLSGGQRQRVAIARAILKDAPILVLDEATSALDSQSEVLIQQALNQLMEGRTTIVVAHRLSTIQQMDRILVLEDGAITEQGTHRQLLAKKGTYAKLWNHQSGGFLED